MAMTSLYGVVKRQEVFPLQCFISLLASLSGVVEMGAFQACQTKGSGSFIMLLVQKLRDPGTLSPEWLLVNVQSRTLHLSSRRTIPLWNWNHPPSSVRPWRPLKSWACFS